MLSCHFNLSYSSVLKILLNQAQQNLVYVLTSFLEVTGEDTGQRRPLHLTPPLGLLREPMNSIP